jgi:uncharacterized damage-inducible protein DinB
MTQGTMSRAQQLAAELTTVNDEILAAVANATPEQWQRVTESEHWPAAVVAHHTAQVERFFTGVIAGVADDNAAPAEFGSADVEANNARHAAEFANVDRAETLAALRANGAALAERIRDLDDDQLTRVAVVFDGQELTAEQIFAMGVIAHLQEHLASLRQAFAG